MKKMEYLAPEMEIVKIGISSMICASDGSTSIPGLSDEYSDDDPA